MLFYRLRYLHPSIVISHLCSSVLKHLRWKYTTHSLIIVTNTLITHLVISQHRFNDLFLFNYLYLRVNGRSFPKVAQIYSLSLTLLSIVHILRSDSTPAPRHPHEATLLVLIISLELIWWLPFFPSGLSFPLSTAFRQPVNTMKEDSVVLFLNPNGRS